MAMNDEICRDWASLSLIMAAKVQNGIPAGDGKTYDHNDKRQRNDQYVPFLIHGGGIVVVNADQFAFQSTAIKIQSKRDKIEGKSLYFSLT